MSNQSSDIGFVLSTTPYREFDCMVHFLGEKSGLIRLVVPGYYKPTSKQGSLGLEFSKVNYRFNFKENSLNRVRTGELLESHHQLRQNFKWLLQMSLICEIIIRTYDPSHHDIFYARMDKIMGSDATQIQIILAITEIIRLQGVSPNVDACVRCGDTGINTFSIEYGGFLCAKHSPSTHKDSKMVLVALKGLFDNQNVEAYLKSFDTTPLLERLVRYLEYHSDMTLNSWQLMLNV